MQRPNYYTIGIQAANVDVRELTNQELKTNYLAESNVYAFLVGCFDKEYCVNAAALEIFEGCEKHLQQIVDEANRRHLQPKEWRSEWFALNHPVDIMIGKHTKERTVRNYAKD